MTPKKAILAMEIIDLNDDCLAEILSHLNLVDLTSVSTTNKKFNEIARLVFSHKNAQSLIEVNSSNILSWHKTQIQYMSFKHSANIKPDFKSFFYYFGEFITKLQIQFDVVLSPKQIERNFFLKCRNLIELKLIGIQKSFFTKSNAQFLLIEKLSIHACCIYASQLRDLLRWFPAVIHLELDEICEVIDIVKDCNNVQSLNNIGFNRNLLRLKSLKLSNTACTPGWISAITFESMEDFEIILHGMYWNWLEFVLKLKQLKKLTIKLSGLVQYGRSLIDDIQFSKCFELPNLEEITLKQAGDSVSIKAVKEIILKHSKLRRLKLIYCTGNKDKRNQFLSTDFNSMWNVYLDRLAIVIEKKLDVVL